MAPQASQKSPDPTAAAIEEEAVAWYVRLSGGHAGDDDRSEHMDWLLSDPRHIRAYEAVCERLQTARAAEPAVRTAYAFDFLKHQPGLLSGVRSYMRTGLFWPRMAVTVAALLVMAFFVLSPRLPYYHAADLVRHYAAPAHTSLTVRLMDGTRVALGAGTEIAVHMANGRRMVEMGPGRAYFEVRHLDGKPFYVNTARRQVRVVGTRFEVVDSGDRDTITVAEGLVSVCRRPKAVGKADGKTAEKTGDTPLPVLLEAGMQLHYPANTDTPILRRVDPDTVGVWGQPIPAKAG